MTRSLPLLAFTLTLAACQADAPADDIVATDDAAAGAAPTGELTVTDPFVTAAPAGGTGGVFLTLVGGAAADTLVSADTDLAERVEVHETYDAGDDLRGMREVEGGIAVPAGGTVALAPGGYHVMLMNLNAALAVGDTLDLDLDFAQAGTMAVRVPVVGLDAMPMPSAGE